MDIGALWGKPVYVVQDDVCGLAYMDSAESAERLVRARNGSSDEGITCEGSDHGERLGDPLYQVFLDGEHLGWAEQGWMTPPAPRYYKAGP